MPDTHATAPFGGDTRAADGLTVYFGDGSGAQRVIVRAGDRLTTLLEEALAEAETWPGEWKVEVCSTPTSIFRDLQGDRTQRRGRGGKSYSASRPEEQLLGQIGRRDALAARAAQRERVAS